MSAVMFVPLVALAVFGMIRFCLQSLAGPRNPPEHGGTRQWWLRATGIILLAVGWFTAGLIYYRTPSDDDLPPEIIPKSTKGSEYEMERIGGKVNVYTAQLREEFADLWQGRELAATVAILAAGGCFICFTLAHHRLHGPPEAAGAGPEPKA
jgi:hypothetical protein